MKHLDLDQLRVAIFTPDETPKEHREHLATCPRCQRLVDNERERNPFVGCSPEKQAEMKRWLYDEWHRSHTHFFRHTNSGSPLDRRFRLERGIAKVSTSTNPASFKATLADSTNG